MKMPQRRPSEEWIPTIGLIIIFAHYFESRLGNAPVTREDVGIP